MGLDTHVAVENHTLTLENFEFLTDVNRAHNKGTLRIVYGDNNKMEPVKLECVNHHMLPINWHTVTQDEASDLREEFLGVVNGKLDSIKEKIASKLKGSEKEITEATQKLESKIKDIRRCLRAQIQKQEDEMTPLSRNEIRLLCAEVRVIEQRSFDDLMALDDAKLKKRAEKDIRKDKTAGTSFVSRAQGIAEANKANVVNKLNAAIDRCDIGKLQKSVNKVFGEFLPFLGKLSTAPKIIERFSKIKYPVDQAKKLYEYCKYGSAFNDGNHTSFYADFCLSTDEVRAFEAETHAIYSENKKTNDWIGISEKILEKLRDLRKKKIDEYVGRFRECGLGSIDIKEGDPLTLCCREGDEEQFRDDIKKLAEAFLHKFDQETVIRIAVQKGTAEENRLNKLNQLFTFPKEYSSGMSIDNHLEKMTMFTEELND